MKALTIITLLLSFGGNAQIQKDKVLHFGAGFVIGGVSAYVAERTGISDSKFESAIIATSVSTLAGVLKEVYDVYGKRTSADGKDILWTAIGGLSGSITVSFTIKSKRKNQIL